MPGKSLREPTFGFMPVNTENLSMVFGQNTTSQSTSMLIPTFTRGSKFGLLKASKSTADCLIVRFPRKSFGYLRKRRKRKRRKRRKKKEENNYSNIKVKTE
jgi:hypothetical protein